MAAGPESPRPTPPIVQSPRGDQRTAAVAATARQHDDAPALRVAVEKADPREMREIAPGILHHLNQLDLEILDHGAVDFHHLRRREVRRFEWKFFEIHGPRPVSAAAARGAGPPAEHSP